MKKRIFWRNFSRLVLLILLPFILIGLTSAFITYNYTVNQSIQNSSDMLNLERENLELMLIDIDFLAMLIDNNTKNTLTVKTLLRSKKFSYEIRQKQDFINDIISTPTYSKPFIYSIYIYLDNPYHRFLSSSFRDVLSLDSAQDTQWYNSYLSANPTVRQWVESRSIRSFGKDEVPQNVITLYSRLINSSGVIVLNFKQSYFENMMKPLTWFNHKGLVVVDQKGELLFSNMQNFNPANFGIDFNQLPVNRPVSVNMNGKSELITVIKSEKFGWTYVAFIPGSEFYSIPKRILMLTLTIVFISVIVILILAYRITHKNYIKIINIIDVFQAAEKGKQFPIKSELYTDEYSFILKNVLKTYLSNDILKTQLSQKQLSLKSAELLALQSQLNPHFMFNTLETINLEILSIAKKPINANLMITQLAHLLRYALTNANGTVELFDEIENTKRYIDIQTSRYEDKFFVRWNVDSLAHNFHIVPLLLQPLIENCIYHGIKEKDGRCGIKLSIHLYPEGLHIKITDNGIGIIPEELSNIRFRLANPEIDPGKHIGLYNANKRLFLTFGEKYRISIYSKYRIGTYIHIFIPDSGSNA